MRLPFADQSVVHDEKLVGYLLNPDHPRGGGKARLLLSLGFRRDAPDVLLDVAERGDAVAVPHAYGMKYVVDGEIPTPAGAIVAPWRSPSTIRFSFGAICPRPACAPATWAS
jgi:hypothetical protein